jgi:hypothetical protein
MGIARETWALALICAADMVLTAWLVGTGQAKEANPIMRFYLDLGTSVFVAMKTLLFVAPLFVLELIRRRRPRLVQTLLRLGIALYLIVYSMGVLHVNAGKGSAQVLGVRR